MKRDYSVFKKPMFWFQFLFIGYVLVGFFLIPYIIRDYSIKYIKEELNHTLSIDKITFDPFIFNFSINRLKLENNTSTLLSFEQLYIDFELLKSILESHINFKEVILKDFDLNYIIDNDGNLNLDLLKNKNKKEIKSHNEENNNTIPKIRVQKFEIINSKIGFEDKKNKLRVDITDINSSHYNLNTFENSLASQSIKLKINDYTQLKIDGGIYFKPMRLYGEISINNIYPNEFLKPVEDILNFQLKNSIGNLFLGYEIEIEPELNILIEDSNIELKNIGIIRNKKVISSINAIEVDNLNMLYPKQKLSINKVLVDGVYIDLFLDKQYQTNFMNLINQNNNSDSKEKENISNNSSSKDWDISITNFNVLNSNINITDSIKEFKTKIQNIILNVNNFNLKENSVFDYNVNLDIANAIFKSNGKFSIKPFSLSSMYNLNNFQLNQFQKYIDDYVNINLENANFNTDANLIIKNNITQLNSNYSIKDLEITDKENIPLFLSKELNANSLKYNSESNSVDLKEIALLNPFVFIHIDKNQTLNLANLSKNNKKEANITENKEENNKKKLDYNIGKINIKDASMKFVDLSLPLPFSTNVSHLKGSLNKINSKSIELSQLDFDGNINDYGYAKISGELVAKNLQKNTNISMQFKNVDMQNLTPYTGKFLGKELKDGKLTLDLTYKIINSNLEATNKIVINKITLGKDINSSDALSIPLSLAIAILEDSSGVIDLDLPISGNTDSPEFAVAPIVFKALGNILVKIIASPFSFLGSLLGVEPDELKKIEFENGYAKLTPPTIEKLQNIVKLLEKKPKISLSITPTYNIKDKEILAEMKFKELLQNNIKNQKDKNDGLKYKNAIEELFLENIKSLKLELIKENSMIQKDGKKVFDEIKYYQELKTIIIKNIVIDNHELILLAKNRAIVAKNFIDLKGLKDRLSIEKNIKFDDSFSKWTELEIKINVRE